MPVSAKNDGTGPAAADSESGHDETGPPALDPPLHPSELKSTKLQATKLQSTKLQATVLDEPDVGAASRSGSSKPTAIHNASDTDARTGRQMIDVEERARVCLQHSPYRSIRRVDCHFSDGVLTLRGRVPTFHYKQLAQTAVSRVDGVVQIVNSIEVE